MRDYASLTLRVALGLTFLYSVADRFGVLGPPGTANVSWGTFSRFTAYVGVLNGFLPHTLVPTIAWIDTGLEILVGVALLLGLWLRTTAIVSALMLLIFAVTTAIANGVGSSFTYSIFTASAASFMLATASSSRWSLDRLLHNAKAP